MKRHALIILIISLIVIAGCIGVAIGNEYKHSQTAWSENTGAGIYLKKVIIDDNTTCYISNGGAGVGIYCMEGIR